MVPFFGSIQFAVPILVAIVSVLIYATFYESRVGSEIVQAEIYKSSWFGLLMFLLAVNLVVSAISRYPWRGLRKVGFALTHFGLVLIIAGSAAVIHWGVEGLLTLHIGTSAESQLRIAGDLLEVMTPTGEVAQVSLSEKRDGSVRPRHLSELSLVSYTENAVQSLDFSNDLSVNNPAVQLSLTSARMGQGLEQWLAVSPKAYRQTQLGPAELEILQVDDSEGLRSQLSPPQNTAQNPFGTVYFDYQNQRRSLDIQPIDTNHPQHLQLKDLQITVKGFWSDFRLEGEQQITSASTEMRNPAVQLELASPMGTERWFVFAQGDFPPIRTQIMGEPLTGLEASYQVPIKQPQNFFRVITTPKGELYFASNSSSQGFQSGKLAFGDIIRPGWADFQIQLRQYQPHAQLNRLVIPVDHPTENSRPALQVETPDGHQTWLLWGEPTILEDSSAEYIAAFTPKFLQLPFSVELEDFIVERNEGSESVAMWTSQIRISDPHQDISEERRVWMNHPTWYRGWKIAQASWNPGDLQQSTLQIKREPIWVTALTWSGSLLVVAGIAVMFYGPGLNKKRKSKELSF